MKAKEVVQLTVLKQGVEAGVLSRTKDGCRFEFKKEFLNNPYFDGLSYCMKKENGPFVIQGTNLHPFFAGLLPEGLRLKALVKQLKTSEDDLFSLFASSGSSVVGDVCVEFHSKYSIQPIALKDIVFQDYFSRLLKTNPYAQGEDSIAGVQEKISASMISFPLNIAKANHNYILKLNPKDKPNLIENEFYCMSLAKKCGIKTAPVKYVKDKEGNLALLVTRFDRLWDEAKQAFMNLHQEDACQFLNAYPSEKYRLSINEIAKGIEQFTQAPHVSLLKLMRLYCFSYIIGNGDLHAKNISLQTSTQGFTDLTPAYDLICTHIYGDQKMALKLDGRDDHIKRSDIKKFALRFGLSSPSIIHMLDSLTSDIKKNKFILDQIPMHSKRAAHLHRTILKRLRDLS